MCFTCCFCRSCSWRSPLLPLPCPFDYHVMNVSGRNKFCFLVGLFRNNKVLKLNLNDLNVLFNLHCILRLFFVFIGLFFVLGFLYLLELI